MATAHKSGHSKRGFWHCYIGEYEVSVQLLNWRYLADMRLKSDTNGTSAKQATFGTAEEALRYVGYPIDYVPMPVELVGYQGHACIGSIP